MRDALRRIGGPDAISWVTFVFLFPGCFLFSALGSGVPLRPGVLGPFTLAVLVAGTAMSLWLLLARRLIFGRRGSPARAAPHPAQVLLAFAIALVIRAGLVDTLFLRFGITEQPRFAYRLVASLPSTGAGLLMLAVAVSLAGTTAVPSSGSSERSARSPSSPRVTES